MSKGLIKVKSAHGPKTSEGLALCRAAPWRHGLRSADARQAAKCRGEAQRLIKKMNSLFSTLIHK